MGETNTTQAAKIISLESDIADKQTEIDTLVEQGRLDQIAINNAVEERDDLKAKLQTSLDNAANLKITIGDRNVQISELNDTITELKEQHKAELIEEYRACLLYTSPSPRDRTRSRMPSSA